MRTPFMAWSFLFSGLLAFCAAWVTLNAEFTFQHPQAPGVRFSVDSNGRVALADRNRMIETNAGVERVNMPRPRALPRFTEHTFEIMNPNEKGCCDFEIYNGGTAPLQLTLEKTSCGCTSAELIDRVVQPYESGLVKLHWTTDQGPLFLEGAWIQTNDPKNRRIELVVQGEVAARVLSNRPIVRFKPVPQGSSAIEEFFVYSSVWEGFEITSAESSLDGFSHTIERVDSQETLAYLGAKSAHQIRLTTPTSLPKGDFKGVLYLTVQPSGLAAIDAEKIAVPFLGQRRARVGLYGEGVDPSGFIDLGRVDVGESIHRRFILKLNDVPLRTDEIHVQVTPPEVDARIVASQSPGLYYLDLGVPSSIGPCSFLAPKSGSLKLTFDDSRLDPIELSLHFVVIQP